MAITATQGLMAVGLLSVLFGADLMTLFGSSKVITVAYLNPCIAVNAYNIWCKHWPSVMQEAVEAPTTQSPALDQASLDGKVHISFCGS